MTATPPMTQPSRAIGPAACEAAAAPNSQPEPMMEVSDAQVAPINPISRLRPTSEGAFGGAATDSVDMFRTFFRVRIRGPYGLASRPMVMISKQPEKKS